MFASISHSVLVCTVFCLYVVTVQTFPFDQDVNETLTTDAQEDELPATNAPQTYEEGLNILLQIASIPAAPHNTTDDILKCTPECGIGPQLACPSEGNCGEGQHCCFDTCRRRQVCRPNEIPSDFSDDPKNHHFSPEVIQIEKRSSPLKTFSQQDADTLDEQHQYTQSEISAFPWDKINPEEVSGNDEAQTDADSFYTDDQTTVNYPDNNENFEKLDREGFASDQLDGISSYQESQNSEPAQIMIGSNKYDDGTFDSYVDFEDGGGDSVREDIIFSLSQDEGYKNQQNEYQNTGAQGDFYSSLDDTHEEQLYSPKDSYASPDEQTNYEEPFYHPKENLGEEILEEIHSPFEEQYNQVEVYSPPEAGYVHSGNEYQPAVEGYKVEEQYAQNQAQDVEEFVDVEYDYPNWPPGYEGSSNSDDGKNVFQKFMDIFER